MIQRMVIGFVISFILKQLQKFEKSVKWDLVKTDLAIRVRALVPGAWFDDEAVAVCNVIVDAAERILEQGDNMKNLLDLLAAQRYQAAVEQLKAILLGALRGVKGSALVADVHAEAAAVALEQFAV